MRYHQTHLEEFVTRFYKNLRIFHPGDLTEENLCFLLGIYLYRKPQPSFSFEHGNFRSITIDSRLSPEEQREQFFHELCHLLRHAGRQTRMAVMFRELQEWDARNFTRYAALPYHMLQLFDFKSPNLIKNLSKQFKVSSQL